MQILTFLVKTKTNLILCDVVSKRTTLINMSRKENSQQSSKLPRSVAARVLMFEDNNKSSDKKWFKNQNTSNGDLSDHLEASSSFLPRNMSFKGRLSLKL